MLKSGKKNVPFECGKKKPESKDKQLQNGQLGWLKGKKSKA